MLKFLFGEYSLLRYDVVESGRNLPTFLEEETVPIFRAESNPSKELARRR
jgi:hypothetical protein